MRIYFTVFFQKRTAITLKLTQCSVFLTSSDSAPVLVSHLTSDGAAPDTLPSVALTVDQCQFLSSNSSASGGLFSLTLPSSSSLSISNTIIRDCSTSEGHGGAVYLVASKSFCNYQFTNVTFQDNSASTGADVFIRADNLMDVVSASKFALNFSFYTPSNSLCGIDSSDYTTSTDLIALFTASEDTIYLGGANATDSFTCGVSTQSPQIPCATLTMALYRLSKSTQTARTLRLCNSTATSNEPVYFGESFILDNLNLMGSTNSTTHTDWGYIGVFSLYDSSSSPFIVKKASTFENIFLLVPINGTIEDVTSIFTLSDANLTFTNMFVSYSATPNLTLVEMTNGYLNATNLIIPAMQIEKPLFNLTKVISASFINCTMNSSLTSYTGKYVFLFSNFSSVTIINSSFTSPPLSSAFMSVYDVSFHNSTVSISNSNFTGAEDLSSARFSNDFHSMCTFSDSTLLFVNSTTTIANSNFIHFPNGAIGIDGGSLSMTNSLFSQNIATKYLAEYPDLSHNLHCTNGAHLNVNSLFNSTDCAYSKPLFFDIDGCDYSSSCFANSTNTLFTPNLTAISTSTTDSYYYVTGNGTNLFPCGLYGAFFNYSNDTTPWFSTEVSSSSTQTSLKLSFSRTDWEKSKKRPLYLKLRYGAGTSNQPYQYTDTFFKLKYIRSKSEIKTILALSLGIAIPLAPSALGIIFGIIHAIRLQFCQKCWPYNRNGKKQRAEPSTSTSQTSESTADKAPPYVSSPSTNPEDGSLYLPAKIDSESDSLTMPSSTVPDSYPSAPQQSATGYQALAYSEPSMLTSTDSNSASITAPLSAPSAPDYNSALPYSLPRKEE